MSTIVIKSLCGFLNHTSTEYSKLEIVDGKVIDTELSKSEALKLIKNLKEIHRIDHNNIIWGDEDFKDKCPKYFYLKINSESPKELIFDNIIVEHKTHSLIIKKDNIVMLSLNEYLNNEFSKLYQHLSKEFIIKGNNICFDDYVFNFNKFNIYQTSLINLYKFKSNVKRFFNEDLDCLIYALTDLNVGSELIDLADKEIETRIIKGHYEA